VIENLFCRNAQYWCWVGVGHQSLQITGGYLWLWLALFASLMVHLPLFFWSRGNITIKPEDPWWKFHVHRQRAVAGDSKMRCISYSMIAYVFQLCA